MDANSVDRGLHPVARADGAVKDSTARGSGAIFEKAEPRSRAASAPKAPGPGDDVIRPAGSAIGLTTS
jgi:hypothetical protein